LSRPSRPPTIWPHSFPIRPLSRWRGVRPCCSCQPDKAAESFRQARQLLKAGQADWCSATLLLAEALNQQNHPAAADDILRVSEALYPEFGSAELKAKLIRAREAYAKAEAVHNTGGR
jgi:hypothetical protein